jgi:TRAP-type uncharacterized transport system fused permease subunit
METIYITVTAMIGIIALGAAAEGYFLTSANIIERILLGVACILLVKPGWPTDVIGGGLLLSVCLFQLFKVKIHSGSV